MKNNKKMPFADFREAVSIPQDSWEHFFCDKTIVEEILQDVEKQIHSQFILARADKTFFGKSFIRRTKHELEEREKIFLKAKIYGYWGRKVFFTRHFYFVSKMIWGLENLLELEED